MVKETGRESRTKLLDAALNVVREKGYTATRIEDICAAAGVTKGSFFHHFESKEALALAAAEHWRSMANGVFETAPYRGLPTARARLLGYVDFRIGMLDRELAEFTCFAGTIIQEAHATHPRIREACERSISDHVAMLEAEIAEAMRASGTDSAWTARGLAFHMQAVIQGAFVLAKAEQSAEPAVESLRHLRRYLETLFQPVSEGET